MSCKYCEIKMRPIDEDMKVLKGENWVDEYDIAMYAHDVGKACMYPDYPCEICEAREKAKKLIAATDQRKEEKGTKGQ